MDMDVCKPVKPLGMKAYGSIGHLPNSRLGPGDHSITGGQAQIATVQVRDKHDRVYVQEKLDGSCVAVAKINGELVPLQRAGYPALTSPYEMHHLFHYWVIENHARFDSMLQEGWRACGEWLAQAHGTKYDLRLHDPFVLFDVIRGGQDRMTVDELALHGEEFTRPCLLADEPISVERAMGRLNTTGFHGAIESVEGAVWRVERKGKVDFLTKYVRPDKVDGIYLQGEPVWNVLDDKTESLKRRFLKAA